MTHDKQVLLVLLLACTLSGRVAFKRDLVLGLYLDVNALRFNSSCATQVYLDTRIVQDASSGRNASARG